MLEVLYTPLRADDGKTSDLQLYPACAVTCAQARENATDDVTLSDSVLMLVFTEEAVPKRDTVAPPVPSPAPPDLIERSDSPTPPPPDSLSPLPLTRERLNVEQRPTLSKSFSSVVSANKATAEKVANVLDNKILYVVL